MTKKVKIERKPMKIKRTRKITEEQREALRERMKDMRKKRKPAEYKNVNERVLVLPDDDTYSFKNVKGWIKHNKEMVAALGKQGRGRHIGEKEQRRAEMQAASRKAYIRYCEYYLRSGDWIGMFSGANEEHKVVPRVIAMAYNPDGTPKRSVGFWYPDIRTVWTKEMDAAPIKAVKKLQAITDKQFTANL